MSTNSELIAKQLAGAIDIQRHWGVAMYNVLVEGLVGDGETDNTVALQRLIDKAVAVGRKAIFFPHGVYNVESSLTNADQVCFFGDNASFTGVVTGDIAQIGSIENANVDGGNFDDPYQNPVVNGGMF